MTDDSRFTPLSECLRRHDACRVLLAERSSGTGGILITGSSNLFYLTGTAANGILWLPLTGDPVLAVRKGLERAQLESPLARIVPFRSFRELEPLFADMGSPLTATIAVDMTQSSWETGRMLVQRLPGRTFVPADDLLSRAKAMKSEWELANMREAGKRLRTSQRDLLPPRIRPGMSEAAVAHALWACNFELGHIGPQESGMQGSGVFLGHIAAGDNGNHPSAYDGPVGLAGAHPAAPFMGSDRAIWEKGMALTVDTGFNYCGYLSDRTQIFFAGREKDIPDSIHKAHDAARDISRLAASMLVPGAIPAAIYKEVMARITASGFAEGFMGLGDNKVRFVGHGIGLTVSEWPIIAGRFTEPLAQGMTIALEPKIGIPGMGMVGVENTFEITANGAKNLTGDDAGNSDEIICIEAP